MNQESRTHELSHDEIAALAQKIYFDSGCAEGRSVENWLAAEKLLQNRFAPQETPNPLAGETPTAKSGRERLSRPTKPIARAESE